MNPQNPTDQNPQNPTLNNPLPQSNGNFLSEYLVTGAPAPAPAPAPDPSSSSLLQEILAKSDASTSGSGNPSSGTPPTPGVTPPPNNNPKKPRDPVSAKTIFKLIGTLLVVGFIFLGIFLAYIVFNPDKSTFFINVFHIDPADIANLLKTLVNASFGIVSFIISVILIIALFQSFWTPKEQKRKKTLAIITSIITGIIFLSVLSFWAFLFEKIKNTDFTNPGGNILVYDNNIYTHEAFRRESAIFNFTNLIGPISLRYDISQNAKQVSKTQGGTIESFYIDFDGAICSNGESKISGYNPENDQAIICTFDKVRNYAPKGEYKITLRGGKEESIPINLPQVEIRGLINIENNTKRDGKEVRIFDASAIANLGNGPRWVEFDSNYNTSKEYEKNIHSITPTDTPVGLWLRVFQKDWFDRIFIIRNTQHIESEGKIEIIKDPSNSTTYTMNVVGTTFRPEEVLDIHWQSNSLAICPQSQWMSCTHNFVTEGDYKIIAKITLINKQIISIEKNLLISAPLKLDRGMVVTNRAGNVLNTKETFDPKNRQYVIKKLSAGESITMDARDIVPSLQGYILKSVKWTINNGKNEEVRNGEKIDFTVNYTTRHNILAEYTFEKTAKSGRDDDIRIATERLQLDLDRENLSAVLKLSPESGYIPIKITADASQSTSKYSEIVKFEFDFWEGRPKAIGDAIQTYEYTTAGEKTISLTIVDRNGEKSTTQKTIILKDTPKKVQFTSSLSPWLAWRGVDFRAEGTTGQVEDYLWNFGDNTPIEHGFEVTHTFDKPGTYKVTLTVRYLDGTESSQSSSFTVVDSLE